MKLGTAGVRILLVCLSWVVIATAALAVEVPASRPAELLWSGDAPGALGRSPADLPTIAPYPVPDAKRTGAAVVVCPGGGYANVVIDREGYPVAQWLNSLGVSAYVLRYRVAPYRYPAPLLDAQRAIRTVRAKAGELKLDPRRIGIMGFSAGGHLASTAATHFDAGQPDAPDPIDRVSCRPDFAILVYPVITFSEPCRHEGSMRNLLGREPDPALREKLSNERQVTAQTPPSFLVHGSDDKVVPVENSILFYQALRKAGVPAEMHLYEHGEHGFGLWGRHGPDPVISTWPGLCGQWLGVNGFLTPPR